MNSKQPWIRVALAGLFLACTCSPTPFIAQDTAPRIDLQLEQEFDRLVKKAAEALAPNQRLVASRHYEPNPDGSYSVYAIRDTADAGVLRTERVRLQLQLDASNHWQVADSIVEESTERLFRESAEPQQFFSFGSIQLDREGMQISATQGTAMVFLRDNKPSRIVFAAPDLEYAYQPPRESGTYRRLYGVMRGQWAEDFVFQPTVVEISCDPDSCDDALSLFEGRQEVGQGDMLAALQAHHEAGTTELESRLSDDRFAGFRLPEGQGKHWYKLSVVRDKDHAITLGYDSLSGHEVRFGASGFENLYGYPAAASVNRVDPASIEARDDSEGELYELVGLTGTIELGVLEPELVQADVTFTIKAKRQLDAVPFSLQPVRVRSQPDKKADLYVNGIEDGDGNALSWVRGGQADGVVLLPEPIPAGAEIVLRMRFQTKGSLIKVNASYSYLARGGWLPFVRYNDGIENFDLTVKVPWRYKTLGVGSAVGEAKRVGNVNVSRWVAESAVQFPTVIFGDYREDAPRSKATKRDGTAIPVTVYVDKSAMTEWGIRPGQLRAPGEIAVNALNVYRELFGVDYPYGKLDLVNDPLQAIGAQAPASIVYLGSAIFRSEATLANAINADSTSLVEEFISHEVAHQWWGSLVSSANFRNYWFVESLAEYSSALFMEIVESEGYQKPEKGRKAYLRQVANWHTDIMNSALLCSVQDAPTLWDNGGYVAAVYDRGPYAFHMLRETFGDKKFFAFLKSLALELGGREVVSRDIQSVAERAFGGTGSDGRPYTADLEWFFDQWIRGIGMPQFRFEYRSTQAEDGGYIVQGKIGQTVFAGTHEIELDGLFYRGVAKVTVLGKDRMEYGARVVVDGPETPFKFKVPSKPVEVTLNKHGEILARPTILE